MIEAAYSTVWNLAGHGSSLPPTYIICGTEVSRPRGELSSPSHKGSERASIVAPHVIVRCLQTAEKTPQQEQWSREPARNLSAHAIIAKIWLDSLRAMNMEGNVAAVHLHKSSSSPWFCSRYYRCCMKFGMAVIDLTAGITESIPSRLYENFWVNIMSASATKVLSYRFAVAAESVLQPRRTWQNLSEHHMLVTVIFIGSDRPINHYRLGSTGYHMEVCYILQRWKKDRHGTLTCF